MTSSTTNAQTIALRNELFSTQEESALAGFLAGYSGLTREAYMLDLRQCLAWCAERRVVLFGARRAHIEAFGRHLEPRAELERRSRASLHHRVLLPLRRARGLHREVTTRCTSAGRNSTTNRTPRDSTATKSVPCSSQPGWATCKIMRSSAFSHSTGFGSPKRPGRISRHSVSSEDTGTLSILRQG